MVQSNSSGRQAVARTPSPQDWGRQSIYSPDGWGEIWTPVLTQPETALCLPEMGACSLSFYLELISRCPKLCLYCPAPSVLLDPVYPSGDCLYPTKDVLGVRTLKMMAESSLKYRVGKALLVWFCNRCSKVGVSPSMVSRSQSSVLAFWDFPGSLKFWGLLSNPKPACIPLEADRDCSGQG